MIQRTYNFENEKQAKQFDQLYIKMKQHKLTVEDATFGIGRTATDKELIDFFDEEDIGEDLLLDQAIERIKSNFNH